MPGNSRRPRLAGSPRRTVVTVLLTSLVSLPAWADPAMDWVQRMSDAMRNLNYHGVFVYMHENQLESMQISHRRDLGGEKERLISLNGEAREVIRDNQNLTCIWPSSRKVVVDSSRKNSFSPIFIPDDIARLEKFYELKLLGEDRVAGSETVIVHIDPRDEFRYGMKFWINSSNALMMKSSLLDESGREIEQVMFTSLTVYDDPAELEFDTMPQIDDSYTLVRYHRGNGDDADDGDDLWQLAAAPRGFWRESVLKRRMPESGQTVRQMVYTDGLASLSIFIEKQGDGAHQGGTSMGAVNAYMRLLADHSITAIGEVPAITVRQVAEAVTYRGQ